MNMYVSVSICKIIV